jgi:hypothetical protein
MSKRFGRNQKHKLNAKVAQLEKNLRQLGGAYELLARITNKHFERLKGVNSISALNQADYILEDIERYSVHIQERYDFSPDTLPDLSVMELQRIEVLFDRLWCRIQEDQRTLVTSIHFRYLTRNGKDTSFMYAFTHELLHTKIVEYEIDSILRQVRDKLLHTIRK